MKKIPKEDDFQEEEYKLEKEYLIKLRIKKENNEIMEVSVQFRDSNALTIVTLPEKYRKDYYAMDIESDRDYDIYVLEEIVKEFSHNEKNISAIESKYDIKIHTLKH